MMNLKVMMNLKMMVSDLCFPILVTSNRESLCLHSHKAILEDLEEAASVVVAEVVVVEIVDEIVVEIVDEVVVDFKVYPVAVAEHLEEEDH